MKKYRKIAYLFLIVIIIVLSMALYVNISKGSEGKEEERKTSEINFLEEKLVNLFNEMNNIQTRNYSISVSEISEQSNKKIVVVTILNKNKILKKIVILVVAQVLVLHQIHHLELTRKVKNLN